MNMTRRSLLGYGLALPAMALGSQAARASQSRPPEGAVAVPFDMPGYMEPTFADQTFNITDFGAEPGGEVMNTQAIARAIAACHEAGGGRVLVPAGVWLTGPIHLRTNVNLHLHDEAEVRFSRDFDDYLPVVYMQRAGVRCYNYSPFIYAHRCFNIAVTGKGTLNGQARHWWRWRHNQPGMLRLMEMNAKQVPIEERVFGTVEDGVRTTFIHTIDCQNVLLEGFTLLEGPSWMIHPVTCFNVTVRGIRIDSRGPNNDGIDPDACRNVVIEHSTFNTGDDAICLKAGRDQDGWAVGKPCQNVVVRHCIVHRGGGGIVFGSEMSGDIRNVFVHDCLYDGTGRGIQFKSLPSRGGVVENVIIQDITMRDIHRRSRDHGPVLLMRMNYHTYPGFEAVSNDMPTFRNIHLRNIHCESAEKAVEIIGIPGVDAIHSVTMENINIRAQHGWEMEYVRNVHLKNVQVGSDHTPIMRWHNCREVSLDGAKATTDADVFLQIQGEETRDIQLRQVKAPSGEAIMVDEDVPRGAVQME